MNPKVRAYFELLRFPAVFTAIADVMMGFLVTLGSLHPMTPLLMLATASALLYLAGMVLNEVFDAKEDAEERPHRPIPSRRITPGSARILGWGLLAVGLLVAAHLGYHGNSTRTTVTALALALCIVLYNAGAKRTPLGPLVMGGCRTLNVLLGMSLATAVDGMSPRPWTPVEITLAAGVGVYIAGVTVFARNEARGGRRSWLAAGIAVILAGLLLIAAAPMAGSIAGNQVIAVLKLETPRWLLLWTLLAVVIVRRCLIAWRDPRPEFVQQAVRNCLRSIIVIDAAIVLGFCGAMWGCTVLALLVPMLVLERWANTT